MAAASLESTSLRSITTKSESRPFCPLRISALRKRLTPQLARLSEVEQRLELKFTITIADTDLVEQPSQREALRRLPLESRSPSRRAGRITVLADAADLAAREHRHVCVEVRLSTHEAGELGRLGTCRRANRERSRMPACYYPRPSCRRYGNMSQRHTDREPVSLGTVVATPALAGSVSRRLFFGRASYSPSNRFPPARRRTVSSMAAPASSTSSM